jgi:HK97 family phage portal protein|tara:strand:- start:2466 stop:3737 length:1272 start_codon:yes stop_codon:yes gene_type:complete
MLVNFAPMRFSLELDFLRLFKRKSTQTDTPEERSINVTSPFMGIFGRNTKSGVTVTEEGALSLSAVYAAVSKISSTMASLPLNLYEDTVDGKRIAKEHPAFVLINSEPNDQDNSFNFIERMFSDALLYGCAYALIERGQITSRPSALHPLDPTMISADVYEGQKIFRDKSSGETYFPDDLIILEAFRGKSPILLHMENLGITSAAMEYGARFFGTGGNTGGFLMTDKSLTDEQYHRLKSTWSNQHQGINNAHETAILEHGLKYQASTIPPDQAQFIMTRKFQVEEVARIYNIPPILIQAEGSTTYNNVEQILIVFAQQTLIPWARKMEMELDRKLIPERERGKYQTKFDMKSLLRGDLSSRRDFYATALQHGFMSVNEVRKMEDLNGIGSSGDVHLIQVNQIPLESAEAYGDKLTQKGDQSNT